MKNILFIFKNMKFYFLLVLFSNSLIFYSQELSINATFSKTIPFSELKVSTSIDEKSNSYVTNLYPISVINSKFLFKKMNYDCGILNISKSVNNPNLIIFYEQNDSISFKINEDENHNFSVTFNGKNSKGLNYLNNENPFTFKNNFLQLYNIIEHSISIEEVVLKIKNQKNNLLLPFKDFYVEKEISSDFYKSIELYADSHILLFSVMCLEDFLRIENNKNKTKLSTNDLKKIINNLNSIYDPFNLKYSKIKSLAYFENISNKSRFIEEGIIKGLKNDIGLWNFGSGKSYYDYAPTKLQEELLVNAIATNYSDNTINYETFLKYKEIFPESIYIPFLENYFKSIHFINDYSFIKYEKNQALGNLDTTIYKSFVELISEKFSKKNVFIDVWATYCAPCKEQFKFNEELHSFLRNNDIEILYISLDSEKNSNKWLNDVKDYKLYGNHYLATSKIMNELKDFLNENEPLLIPRYFIINKKGELVLPSTKKPSEKEDLYKQILNALNEI